MNFEYAVQPRATADIEIEDPYNCCLKANNLLHEEYYLYIKTVMGETQIVYYGPHTEKKPKDIGYSYSRIPFSEKKIQGIIDKFLNSHDIFQAEEVDLEDIRSCFENLIDIVG